MKKTLLIVAVAVLFAVPAFSAEIMPSFANAPTGWTVDRYAPDYFGNVGAYMGRSDVLGIGISAEDSLANRPAGFQSMFYNTQGDKHLITGVIGDSISADLFVEEDWASPANGTVRSDIWGTTTGSGGLGWAILGFTNQGGTGRFRAWDDVSGLWTDFQVPVAYGQWTTLGIQLVNTGYTFSVNGTVVGSTSHAGRTGFSEVIMQAYNFGDRVNFPNEVPEDYTAHWANTQPVPEPATLTLLGLGLAGVARAARRRKK